MGPESPARPPRAIVLLTPHGVVDATLESADSHQLIVRTTVALAIGERMRVSIPFTRSGRLDLDATVRWMTRDRVGLQLGPLRARDVFALHRLAG